ncbi:MAG: TonB-dependent receptor [Gemmatimonadales bacterium]|nr:MAG: TonB-dependent receptor [Gemmatimonadales bacterium]
MVRPLLLALLLASGTVLAGGFGVPSAQASGPTDTAGVPAAGNLAALPDTIIVDTLRADTIPPPGRIQPPLGPDGPIELEGVTVRILRSPMRIDNAPFSVSSLTDEIRLRGRSDSSIEEALQGLPGVQVQNRFNDAVGERISIRGFGGRSPFGARGVRILVDGIPATMPDGQATLDHLDLGSLGAVEALRGPGSALYGNASGGVLDFRTQDPAEGRVRQEFKAVDGDHGLQRVQSTTSGSIGDVGYLLNLSRYGWGGYRNTPGGPEGAFFGSADRDHLNGYVTFPFMDGRARITLNGMELDAENPGAVTAEALSHGQRPALAENLLQQAGKTSRQGQLGASWEGPVRTRFLEVSAWALGLEAESLTTADVLRLDRGAGGVRALLRTERDSEMGRMWWGMGAELDLQRDDRQSWRNERGARGARLLVQDERVLGGAVFIQALLPIAPRLDVLTGLRYDRIRFRARDRMPGTGGAQEGPENDARTLDSASPSFGLHLDLHRGLGLFANLSTAFETPTTEELANRSDGARGFNPDLEPQVGITSEVGARGILLPVMAWEVIHFNTVLYNELVPFEVQGQAGQRYFRNLGRSQRSGFEVSLQFDPDPMISSRLVLSTNDARFREYEVDGTDYRGNRVPGISPRRVEGVLRLGPGRWFAELRGEWNDAIPGDNENSPEAESPSYSLVDFRGGLNDVRILGVEFSPFAGMTNVFDEAYNTSVVVNAERGRHFEPGPGRSIYLGGRIAVER